MSDPSPPPPTSLKILLAEDNVVNQRVTQLILAKLGHELDIVSDGAAAVEAVQQRTYSVVLMDVEMPRLDGLEATRRIRAYFADRDRPYIVAMTASAQRADCMAAGMDDFLLKPVRTADLAGMVERALAAAATWRHQQQFQME
ncbi:MAG TPA: response regulator [Propionibacteriaceae bacterium]|nr:response regulator [Propionibacteriaceae bacterium]